MEPLLSFKASAAEAIKHKKEVICTRADSRGKIKDYIVPGVETITLSSSKEDTLNVSVYSEKKFKVPSTIDILGKTYRINVLSSDLADPWERVVSIRSGEFDDKD